MCQYQWQRTFTLPRRPPMVTHSSCRSSGVPHLAVIDVKAGDSFQGAAQTWRELLSGFRIAHGHADADNTLGLARVRRGDKGISGVFGRPADGGTQVSSPKARGTGLGRGRQGARAHRGGLLRFREEALAGFFPEEHLREPHA